MTIVAWRVTRNIYVKNVASGEGAQDNPGRWNISGVSVVYTAASAGLAMAEIGLDPADSKMLAGYSRISFEFDESLVSKIKRSELSPGWDSIPAGSATRALGTAWVKSNSSAVLCVPSVVSPDENCYIINPQHPDFKKIKVGKPQSLLGD